RGRRVLPLRRRGREVPVAGDIGGRERRGGRGGRRGRGCHRGGGVLRCFLLRAGGDDERGAAESQAGSARHGDLGGLWANHAAETGRETIGAPQQESSSRGLRRSEPRRGNACTGAYVSLVWTHADS